MNKIKFTLLGSIILILILSLITFLTGCDFLRKVIDLLDIIDDTDTQYIKKRLIYKNVLIFILIIELAKIVKLFFLCGEKKLTQNVC